MSKLKDFSDFTPRQLRGRAAWLEKAAAVRDGAVRQNLLAEREVVLAELAKREA